MYGINHLEQYQRDIKDQLKRHKRSIFKIAIKHVISIPFLILITITIPSFSTRYTDSMNDALGWKKSLLIIGTLCLIYFLMDTLNSFFKYKNKKFSIEADMKFIDSKIAKLKEEASI